jgi:translation initiation factor 2 gamma subunit (eIF-2gamma)
LFIDIEGSYYYHSCYGIIFNINKQGTEIKEIKGGVVGGTIIDGLLKINDRVKIFPGLLNEGTKTKWSYKPLISKVLSINTERNNLQFAIPGGLLGIQLTLDPALTAQDRLVGNILKTYKSDEINNDDKVYEILYVYPDIFRKDYKIKKGDTIIINHNACHITCKVAEYKKTKRSIYKNGKKKRIRVYGAELHLIDKPIYARKGDQIAICKKQLNSYSSTITLLGKAEIADGIECELNI